MNLSLTEAFDRFGAKPSNRFSSQSAIAEDGALVLMCSSTNFNHPTRGVLRYEDSLSREPGNTKHHQLLNEHLCRARDGELPIRMVVIAAPTTKSRSRSFHVRPDLLGKLVKFDGNHFVIDFVSAIARDEPAKRRK